MNPKVSVIVVTYNHEKYILSCIESILNQKTEYPFELIICDDCSTDDTSNLISTFLANSNNKIDIKYIRHSKNIGVSDNFTHGLRECAGNYIAICDGDDYWIDPKKIERQVSFLENNPEYVLITENADILDNYGYHLNTKISLGPFDQEYLIFQNICTTCTVLFRKSKSIDSIIFPSLTIIDYPLYLTLLNNGLGYYSNNTSAVYRMHQNGVYTSMSNLKKIKNEIDIFEFLMRQDALKYRASGYLKLQYLYYNLLTNYSNPARHNSLSKIIKYYTPYKIKSFVVVIKSIYRYVFKIYSEKSIPVI